MPDAVPVQYCYMVLLRYHAREPKEAVVPALNVEFSDEEIATVRSAAATAGSSMRAFAKQAILDKAVDREGRVRALGQEIAQRSAELNRRLA